MRAVLVALAAVCAAHALPDGGSEALAPSASNLRFARTFATVFAKAGEDAGATEPKVVSPPSEEGESELDACTSNAVAFEKHIRADNVIDAELPKMMAGWCHSILVSRKDMLPDGVTNDICEKGRKVYEDSPEAGSFDTAERNARLFCEIMRDDFAKFVKLPEEEVEKQQDWTYERPLATKEVDVTADENGHRKACCKGHGHANCFDSEISKCVCAVDPVCCEAKWDLKCAEEVESTKCGRCPVE